MKDADSIMAMRETFPSGGPRVAGERGALPAMLWACYLGCSWTWVIGMLLPILLLADFGVWGWIVFAIPNVFGAAAMGFIVRNRAMSERLVCEHHLAVRLFSAVTIAFQLVIVLWFWSVLLSAPAQLAVYLAAFGLLMWRLTQPNRLMQFTLAVFTISLICFIVATTQAEAFAGLSFSLETTNFGGETLWLFAPASIMGFLLCPYLDRTFHHARQCTSVNTGRAAFVIGFGVVFASMIVFSLGYAYVLRPVFFEHDLSVLVMSLPTFWVVLLTVHLSLQALYTVIVHSKGSFSETDRQDRNMTGIAAGVGLLFWLGLTYDYLPGGIVGDMPAFQAMYRLFLMCYGLLFPAYVWLCMLPRLRGGMPSLRQRHGLTLIAVVIALPMAYAAFMLGCWWWVLGVLAVLVIARLVVEFMREVPIEEAGAQ